MPTCVCAQYLEPLQTPEDVRKRCDVTPDILKSCDIIERGNWLLLERCRVCGRCWVREYPYSGQHGGGPRCAYNVPDATLPAEGLTSRILDEDSTDGG